MRYFDQGVLGCWHQIGIVHEDARQFQLAEQAYQRSLSIKVQLSDRGSQGSTLNQPGLLYATLGRPEDAVRLLRQAADIAVPIGDLRSEGIRRSNIADELLKLNRYDEARSEIERAIECKKSFGHVAMPWTTFAILSNLERCIGNQPAALEARARAIAAYLAYRRDGGAPPNRCDTAHRDGQAEPRRSPRRLGQPRSRLLDSRRNHPRPRNAHWTCMKNVTLSAEDHQIEQARDVARAAEEFDALIKTFVLCPGRGEVRPR